MSMSILERLDRERSPKVPATELGTAGEIRRAFFNGEELTSKATMERWGVTGGMHSQIVLQLEALGFRFTKTPEAGKTGRTAAVSYRLTNPKHKPTPAQVAASRARQSKFRKASPNGHSPAVRDDVNLVPVSTTRRRRAVLVPHFPDIASELMVTGIQWDPDTNESHLQLRNGKVRYTVRIDGQMVLEPVGVDG